MFFLERKLKKFYELSGENVMFIKTVYIDRKRTASFYHVYNQYSTSRKDIIKLLLVDAGFKKSLKLAIKKLTIYQKLHRKRL